jgi:Holliday junction resolvase RusA-like endonuclease
MTWLLTVHGAPRTKKNHGSVIQRGNRRFHIPSAAWTNWATDAPLTYRYATHAPPIGVNVNCRALFYRDALRGDAVGFYQGLADLLEKRGIVTDDKVIVSWDGSRLLKDADRPRVEVQLEEVS